MAKHYNYEKLMNLNPMSYGEIVNSIGQTIEFLEHPTQGDMAEVICVFHDEEKAADSGFFDTDDMENEDGDYVPSFIDGKLHIGEFEA